MNRSEPGGFFERCRPRSRRILANSSPINPRCVTKEHEKGAIRLSSLMRRLIPRRSGIPHRAIVPQKVDEKPLKNGVEDLLCKSSPLRGLKTSQRFKGMHPLGCLPLWGDRCSRREEWAGEELIRVLRLEREGVTLVTG